MKQPAPAPSSKEDRRVARTRRALREALLELIQEKGYDAVTVEEITSRANLGRATFYLHYKDKEELLLEQFGEIASERARQLSEIPLAAWQPEASPPLMPLLTVFEHAAQNADLYRLVMRGDGHFRVADRLRAIIAGAIQDVIQAKSLNEPPGLTPHISIELLSAYFAGALLGTIAWQLEQDPPSNPHEMARTFQTLFIPGVRQVFDRPE